MAKTGAGMFQESERKKILAALPVR